MNCPNHDVYYPYGSTCPLCDLEARIAELEAALRSISIEGCIECSSAKTADKALN